MWAVTEIGRFMVSDDQPCGTTNVALFCSLEKCASKALEALLDEIDRPSHDSKISRVHIAIRNMYGWYLILIHISVNDNYAFIFKYFVSCV